MTDTVKAVLSREAAEVVARRREQERALLLPATKSTSFSVLPYDWKLKGRPVVLSWGGQTNLKIVVADDWRVTVIESTERFARLMSTVQPVG